MTTTTNEARPVKRRRATKAEMQERYEAILELAAAHHPCSVRHVFYRAVVAGIPHITKDRAGYAKVQRALLDLRRDGAVPYSWITDNSRSAYSVDTWDGVDEFLTDMAGVYRRNVWRDSPHRVEVWCESDSISGTVRDVTRRWRIRLYPLKGQSSETFAHNAADFWMQEPERQPVVVYIGDHDPAGLEIEVALQEKLARFTGDWHGRGIVWTRLGVTWEQASEFDLPGTRPKKDYGFPLSVEAEALPPRLLRSMLDDEIAGWVDDDQIEYLRLVEQEERDGLRALAETFGGAA